MARLKTRIREGGNRLWDLVDERSAAESLMNQRLGLFLILFAIIIVGAINTQKKILFLSVLFLGAVICWVLAYTIIRLAKKIGVLTKEINSFEGSNKGSGKTARMLLGYFVPIFCSSILVLVFFVGSFGWIDYYLWPSPISVPQIERKVEQAKNDIKETIRPRKDSLSQNFQNVNQVIEDSNVYNSGRKYTQLEKTVKKEVTPLSPQVRQNNFKNIDSVMISSQVSPRNRSYVQPNTPTNTSAVKRNVYSNDPHFTDINRIITEGQSVGRPIQNRRTDKKQVVIPPEILRKGSPAPPSRNFKNIDSVIKK